jgi:type IV secretory pathway TrbD component
MKAAFIQASERWCQISFLGGLLTCALYLLTENWWSAVFALGCGLVFYVTENMLLYADLRMKEGAMDDMKTDLARLMRATQTMTERNAVLEQRLWRIESTYLVKVVKITKALRRVDSTSSV